MFFEILGWIFLVILCVVAFYVWKLYRFIKRQSNSDIAVAMSALPAQDMELEPSNREEWVEQERLTFTESELKQIGAQHIGYYTVHSGYAVIKVSLWDVKSKAAAVIYEASSTLDEANVVFMFEVACKLDKGSVCITTNPSVTYSARPAEHIAIHQETASILQLIKLIKPSVPETRKLTKIDNVKEFFIECYKDTTEYAWQKSQLTSPKMRQTFESLGVKITDELMEQLIEIGESYSIEVNIEKARNKLAKHSKMSAEKWEKIRDKIIIINELMTVDHIIDAVYEVLGEPSEMQEQVLEGFQINTKKVSDPIGAFQLLAQSLNLKVTRLTQMNEPIKTEIYLSAN